MKRYGCLLLLLAADARSGLSPPRQCAAKTRGSVRGTRYHSAAGHNRLGQDEAQEKKQESHPDGPNFPPEAFDPEMEIEWGPGDPKVQDAWKKMYEVAKKVFEEKKQAEEKKVLTDQMKEIGILFLDFCKNSPQSARSAENFKSYVRRAGQMPLYDLLKEKKVAVVLEADINTPENIVAFIPLELNQTPPSRASTPMMWSNQFVGSTTIDVLNYGIVSEQLKMVWTHYISYVDELRKSNAFDKSSLDGFKRRLKESAPPSLLELVDSAKLVVVDPRVPSPWIAWSSPQSLPGIKGRLGIMPNGAVGYVPDNFVPPPPPKM